DRLREVLLRLNLHERCRQRRLAVVDVTDRADVHVGLVLLEFFLGHLLFSTLLVAEPTSGLDPETSSLPRKCSTTELGGRFVAGIQLRGGLFFGLRGLRGGTGWKRR